MTEDRADGRQLEILVRGAMDTLRIRDVAQLAAMCGIHRNTLYRNLNGRQRPTRRTMSRMAAVLGLDPDDLWRANGGAGRASGGEVAMAALDRLGALVEALEGSAVGVRETPAGELLGRAEAG